MTASSVPISSQPPAKLKLLRVVRLAFATQSLQQSYLSIYDESNFGFRATNLS